VPSSPALPVAADLPATLALEEALVAAEAALTAGDAPAAAQAAAQGAAACDTLARAPAPLDPATLARLRALHARCTTAALAALDRLAGDARRAGRSRRALAAYGSRRPG